MPIRARRPEPATPAGNDRMFAASAASGAGLVFLALLGEGRVTGAGLGEPP